ncbi:DUF4280 domain-containing protein [Prevotella fusca JCM 17724]|uniref:DUF4280 domain-containing protein n=2 Tax=Prevotella fusca TaxID=589436 RepID=A0A0K1NMS9_9BACT|nr:DUF4280 domain-containing protein [Prevotella fusca]AKU70384.1 hypothetical protein ADJ77_11510 [Prevotella fusca JCM 17724]QUB86017.1 DUF4280 domain-containing protein [Prevotella fusca JCM 17724]
MMSTLPSQIVTERKAKVLYGKEKKALLNTCDKKLTCQLQCRIKVSYYDGLSGLLLGLTLGAAVVALTVLTCGAGAAVVGAAVAIATTATNVAFAASMALFVGGAASYGAAATYKYLANECDDSLTGEWGMFHGKAKIEGHNALLERSMLTCSKGGVVTLVMDHAKALELAQMISKTNNEISNVNAWSKIKQGFIGNVSNALLAGFQGQAAGSAIAVIIGSGLSVYFYCTSDVENFRDSNVRKQNSYAKSALEKDDDQTSMKTDHSVLTSSDGITVGSVSGGGLVGAGTEVVATVTIRNDELAKESMKQNENALKYILAGNEEAAEGAYRKAGELMGKQQGVTANSFKEIFTGKTSVLKFKVPNGVFIGAGLAIGVLGAMWNNHIEGNDNEDENILYKDMVKEIIKSRKENKKKITIVANTL